MGKEIVIAPENKRRGWWALVLGTLSLALSGPAYAITQTVVVPAGNSPVEVVPENGQRYGFTAQIASGAPATAAATCSQTSQAINEGASFPLTTTALALNNKAGLWCRSTTGAPLTINYSLTLSRSSSLRVPISANANTEVLPEDYTRRRATVINSHGSIAVSCGYECPMSATTQNVTLPAAGASLPAGRMEFLAGLPVCCYASSASEVVVVVEK